MNNNLLYYCLKQVYTNVNIKPRINITSFNPQKEKITPNIDIAGLYTKHHYVNRAYKTLSRLCIIDFDDLGYNVRIKIYYTDKLFNDKYIIQEIICRVYTMLYLFENNNINYEIIMLLYKLPRIIPCTYISSVEEINDITPKGYFNCTNGYYQYQGDKKFILVTRYNDSMGLLIHELCHAVGIDIGGYDTFAKWKSYYNIHFNGKAGYFTEGINNANASIIHSMFLSIKYNVDFNVLINNECDYVYNQCCKLVSYYFKDNKQYHTISDLYNIYTQNGQMFEYNILRYIYLSNRDKLYNFKNIKDVTIPNKKLKQGYCSGILWVYPNDINLMDRYYTFFINKLSTLKFKNITDYDYDHNNIKFWNMDYFSTNFNIPINK